jgi:signal transduction histidine kinase
MSNIDHHMSTQPQPISAAIAQPPVPERAALARPVMLAALLACVLPCGLILTLALISGLLIENPSTYAALVGLYIGLLLLIDIPSRVSDWLWRHLWVFLLALSLVGLAVQAQVLESFLQPIIFLVPLIYAAVVYPGWRVALIGAWLIGLLNLGVWLSGQDHPIGFLFPTFGYGTFMGFNYAFVQLSLQQSAARREADRLAGDLAAQRDYLARLVAITATLTRDLELATVLEQVAAAGRSLAHAAEARVWLRDDQDDDGAPLQLAAAVPRAAASEPRGETIEQLSARAGGNGLVLPLVSKGATIGALELAGAAGGPIAQAQAGRLQPFADAAAVAIENARLYEQARLSATLAERNRLARELHDTIAQGLTAVTMQLEAAQRGFERDPARARARVGRAHELARAALGDVRRSVWTLAAPLIDGGALAEALAELTERFAERTGLAASYAHSGPPIVLGHAAATQVLRVAQEALQNVEKHARAGTVEVRSAAEAGQLRVWVRDDGAGFAALPEPGAGGGFGLLSLHERARLAGGTLQVESAPGAGARVMVTVPMPPAGQAG